MTDVMIGRDGDAARVTRSRGARVLHRLVLSLCVVVTIALGATPSVALETVTALTTGKGSAYDWPCYVAKNKGFFAEVGIDLDLVAASSSAAQVQQLTAGSAGLGMGIGLTDPLRAIDKGAKIAMLRTQAEAPPYTLWGKPALKSIGDLRGKVIIVGGANDITRIYLERVLGQNGIKPGQYDLVYAGTTPARFAALASGAVDAAMLFPPFSFKAQGEGYTLLGRVSDYVKDLPFTVQAVNIEWARKNKSTLAAFLKAYRKSVEWLYRDENKAEAIAILVKETTASDADAEATYDYVKQIHVFSAGGVVDPSYIAGAVKILADEGGLDGPADSKRFLDPEILQLAADAAK
jgi:NitT/TauT family transport system substrate-binding protein